MKDEPDGDAIFIEKLEIAARVGITGEERSLPQRLTFTLTLWPGTGFSGLADRIDKTVDYVAVCGVIRSVAAARPRNLIETLAEETASALMEQFPLAALVLELRKYVLPDTDSVGVRIRRPSLP